MAALSFTVTADQVRPVLEKLRKSTADPTPVLRAMGTTFKSITEGAFNSVGARFRPRPWANLLTVRRDTKGKLTFERSLPSILTRSGALAHSFHLTVSAREARVATPMIYAAIHQFGRTIEAKGRALRFKLRFLDDFFYAKSVTIPARPFFPVNESGTELTPEADRLISRAGERALLRQAGQAGGALAGQPSPSA